MKEYRVINEENIAESKVALVYGQPLSIYVEDAIYCNTWKKMFDYKVWSLLFICCILDLSVSVFTYLDILNSIKILSFSRWCHIGQVEKC